MRLLQCEPGWANNDLLVGQALPQWVFSVFEPKTRHVLLNGKRRDCQLHRFYFILVKLSIGIFQKKKRKLVVVTTDRKKKTVQLAIPPFYP